MNKKHEIVDRFVEAIGNGPVALEVTKGWTYRQAWACAEQTVGYGTWSWLPKALEDATGIRDNHTTFEVVWEGHTIYITLHDWSMLIGECLQGDAGALQAPKFVKGAEEMVAERGVTDFSLQNGRVLKKHGMVIRLKLTHNDQPGSSGYFTEVKYADGFTFTYTGLAWGYNGEGPNGLMNWAKDNGLGHVLTEGLVVNLNNRGTGVVLELNDIGRWGPNFNYQGGEGGDGHQDDQ